MMIMLKLDLTERISKMMVELASKGKEQPREALKKDKKNGSDRTQSSDRPALSSPELLKFKEEIDEANNTILALREANSKLKEDKKELLRTNFVKGILRRT